MRLSCQHEDRHERQLLITFTLDGADSHVARTVTLCDECYASLRPEAAQFSVPLPPATDLHTCPFKEEIHGDLTLCDCDASATHDCLEEI